MTDRTARSVKGMGGTEKVWGSQLRTWGILGFLGCWRCLLYSTHYGSGGGVCPTTVHRIGLFISGGI